MPANQTVFNAMLKRIEENDPTLISVSMPNSGITSSDCILLATKLQNNTVISSIDLGSNSIGVIGITALTEAFPANKAIETLSLYADSLGDDGVQILSQSLQNKNIMLHDLSLETNGIGDNGALYLAQLLQNKLLTSLDLYGNPIGNLGAIAFAQALATNPPVLFLDLGNNPLIGNPGAIALARALQSNTHLIILALYGNTIDDEGAKAFADMLLKNKDLTILAFGLDYSPIYYTRITNIGAQALRDSLEKNYAITRLDLTGSINVTESNLDQISRLTTRNKQCAGQLQPALQCPVIQLNQLTIYQNETKLFTTNNLLLTDVSRTNLLNGRFTASNLIHCEFLNAQNQAVITQFSQLDINNQQILFRHYGTKPPSYMITAQFANLTTWAESATIVFLPFSLPIPTTASPNFTQMINHPPVLMHPLMDQTVSIDESFSIPVPANTFFDPDNQSLTFDVECDDQTLPTWLNFTDQTFRGRASNISSHRLSIFARDSFNATANTTFNLTIIGPQAIATDASSSSSGLLSFGLLIAMITGVSTLVILLILAIVLYRRSHTNKIQMNPAGEAQNTLPLQNNPLYKPKNDSRTIAGTEAGETNDDENRWNSVAYETGELQNSPWNQNTYATTCFSHLTTNETSVLPNNFVIPWDESVYSMEEGQHEATKDLCTR